MIKLGRMFAALLLSFLFSTQVCIAQVQQFHRVKLLIASISVAASGSTTTELDLKGISRANIFLRQTYEATAATTGCSVVQTYAASDPTQDGEVFVYAGNSTTITSLVSPTAAQGTEQETVSEWNVGVAVLPRKVKLTITNTDATNAVVLDVWVDIN
jgi:hypothetical protein